MFQNKWHILPTADYTIVTVNCCLRLVFSMAHLFLLHVKFCCVLNNWFSSIIHVSQFTRLCKSTWGHCSIYNRRLPAGFSYRRLYLKLDEGSLTFNANPQEVTQAPASEISCPKHACYLLAVCSMHMHVHIWVLSVQQWCHYKIQCLISQSKAVCMCVCVCALSLSL